MSEQAKLNVTLRAPEPSDVDMLYELENDLDVSAASWGEMPVSRQMLCDYVMSYTQDILTNRCVRMIIMSDGKPVGTVDVTQYDPVNSRAMLGIALLPAHRGAGIGHKALALAVDYCHNVLNLHQVAAIVARENEASLHIFESLGFKTSGCLRSWIKRGDVYNDAVVLQLLFRG